MKDNSTNENQAAATEYKDITVALRFLDFKNMPPELSSYIYPDGKTVNGVYSLALEDGNVIKEAEALRVKNEIRQQKVDGDDYVLPQFRALVDQDLTPAKLVKFLHEQVQLFNKSPDDVLGDLFREYNLEQPKAVAA